MTATLKPGESPQSLADRLGEGETGLLPPGTYTQAVELRVPGSTLRSATPRTARMMGLLRIARGATGASFRGLTCDARGIRHNLMWYPAGGYYGGNPPQSGIGDPIGFTASENRVADPEFDADYRTRYSRYGWAGW